MTSKLSPVEKLVLAGYRREQARFRLTNDPDVDDAELTFWRAPDGSIISEAQAIKELEEQEES